jgi:hypothetical protein
LRRFSGVSATGPLVVVELVTLAPDVSVVVVDAVVTAWPVGAAAWAAAVASADEVFGTAAGAGFAG